MKFHLKYILITILLLSCNTGDLILIADLPSSLKETSAIEVAKGSDLFWVIEDSGNTNELFGLDNKGTIKQVIRIENATNKDWEDLTTDKKGNIYIGDFGNNNKKRKHFTIYKIANKDLDQSSVSAEIIRFSLPDKMNTEDFEAFFAYSDWFYIFSKNHKKTKLIKVPNRPGEHQADFITEYELKGKDTEVTSADISEDGKTVVLLNHDKVWKLSEFQGDNFFNGSVEDKKFKHDSQKEGIKILNATELLITDERQKIHGGNMYKFILD